MAFRVPRMTVVLLVLVLLVHVAETFVPRWMRYESGLKKVHVGLATYEISDCGASEPTAPADEAVPDEGEGSADENELLWVWNLDCDGLSNHDNSECVIYRRVGITRFGFQCASMAVLLLAGYNAIFGSGTKLMPFFVSLIFAFTSFVLLLAAYDRFRVSCGSQKTVELGDRQIEDPSFKFGAMFYVGLFGLLLHVALCLQHVATCSSRKYEEL